MNTSKAHASFCNAQDSNFRMLPALGIAAVGCTSSSAFTQSDSSRFTALTHLTPSVSESVDPILLLPSRPTPAPLGPISYNTLSSQQHTSTGQICHPKSDLSPKPLELACFIPVCLPARCVCHVSIHVCPLLISLFTQSFTPCLPPAILKHAWSDSHTD